MTSSLPGIVTALALVTVTIHYARPIYQTEVTLLLAWLLMFMPRALVNLRAGIAQAPVELENVARSLGRSPGRALWSVTMRLAAPGISTFSNSSMARLRAALPDIFRCRRSTSSI